VQASHVRRKFSSACGGWKLCEVLLGDLLEAVLLPSMGAVPRYKGEAEGAVMCVPQSPDQGMNQYVGVAARLVSSPPLAMAVVHSVDG
jgi:hypothetical protein